MRAARVAECIINLFKNLTMDAKDKSVKIKHLKNRDYIKYDRGYKIPMRIFEIVGTPEQKELWAQVHTKNDNLMLFNKQDEDGNDIQGEYIMFTSDIDFKDGQTLFLNNKETNYYIPTSQQEKEVLGQLHKARKSQNVFSKFIANIDQAKHELGIEKIDSDLLQALATVSGLAGNNQQQPQPVVNSNPQENAEPETTETPTEEKIVESESPEGTDKQ